MSILNFKKRMFSILGVGDFETHSGEVMVRIDGKLVEARDAVREVDPRTGLVCLVVEIS